MKKLAAITMTLGLGLLLAAGAWAYGGGGYYGGMMYGNGYGGRGWGMGYGGCGAAQVAAQDQSAYQGAYQGQGWGNGYCPAWGYGQQGYPAGAAPGSGASTPAQPNASQN